MSRYIDADELIRFYEPYADMKVPVDALLEQIKDTSTADVVEVVRCKDCKHHEDFLFDDDKVLCWVHDEDIVVAKNGYCSYGERKEQDHD